MNNLEQTSALQAGELDSLKLWFILQSRLPGAPIEQGGQGVRKE